MTGGQGGRRRRHGRGLQTAAIAGGGGRCQHTAAITALAIAVTGSLDVCGRHVITAVQTAGTLRVFV